MKENQKFCRVILPDKSTTVIYAKPGQTVKDSLAKLCDRRNINMELIEIHQAGTDKVKKIEIFYVQLIFHREFVGTWVFYKHTSELDSVLYFSSFLAYQSRCRHLHTGLKRNHHLEVCYFSPGFAQSQKSGNKDQVGNHT